MLPCNAKLDRLIGSTNIELELICTFKSPQIHLSDNGGKGERALNSKLNLPFSSVSFVDEK